MANDFKHEWSLLQNQFDSYEKHSLFIKLANTALLSAAYISDTLSVFVGLLLLTLWGQDAIWKTFQSRIETRLLQIENCLLTSSNETAYQFNTQYEKTRPGLFGLVSEYARQAIRPTVAYPHLILIIILGAYCIAP